MNWAGIHFDEGPTTGGAYGPYVQSERLELYQQHVEAADDPDPTSTKLSLTPVSFL